ncbi:3-isopropylmalate dehydratase small subunit [Pseudomonas bharatica]|uniref:3-isopropylmalate dehydratase small subunit n=1 Tax=Pseudomonas bharatica TaxID=2692112 RepID=UPI003B281CCF
MMERFVRVDSIAVPLALNNVDTDMIFPSLGAERMNSLTLERNSSFYKENGFANLRYDKQGSVDPTCLFNLPCYQGARILLALENFACGSSREMAVWALLDMGFRCVIAPSFGDIFFSNACANGLLPVRVSLAFAKAALQQATDQPETRFSVDLQALEVTAESGLHEGFSLDEHRRQLMLQGMDEIGYTLKSLAVIEQHEQAFRKRRPWMH